MRVGGQSHAPAALPLVKTWYPLYRRLGGPQGRSGQVGKISPQPGFDPRTVQPVASRYTDWAILAGQGFVKIKFLYVIKLHTFLLSVNIKMCLTSGWDMFPDLLCFENCNFLMWCLCFWMSNSWCSFDMFWTTQQSMQCDIPEDKILITPLRKLQNKLVTAFLHRLNCVNA